MYTNFDYTTKKALKQAVADGKQVRVCRPGTGKAPLDGVVYLEGPHYPKPHTWYAQATLVNGIITKVK